MKQAWFTSVTTEERDQAMAILHEECPNLELHPVGYTTPEDAHVNPFFIVRYEGRFPIDNPLYYNESTDFPAFMEGHNLLEGEDVPEWT
ncbi:MAG: hypothetical protein PVS3B3_30790 [Ktedonobacteraceae bacterium]